MCAINLMCAVNIKTSARPFNFFDLKLKIGVDFAIKVIQLNAKTTIRLQLWDIGGKDRRWLCTCAPVTPLVSQCLVLQ